MRLSELTAEVAAEYLRLDYADLTDGEKVLLDGVLSAAKTYISGYTGIDTTEQDTHEDITIAALVLCQDMYDNRSMYVDKSNVNKVVDSILGMHCVNLL
jgi:uncharacterized phage protein (predicted DNA packaging)